MYDQDDDGTDGTATPPPPEHDSPPKALLDLVHEVDTQLGLILGRIL
jgi:hypothetical protein